MRRRGTWTLYYTNDSISSISDAENATYYEILSPYYLGDPQTDGQENVPTEVYFSFNIPLLASGLKAEITGLDTGVEYSVSLGEFIAYLENSPPEPEPEPEPPTCLLYTSDAADE